jgi:hypothetical protein
MVPKAMITRSAISRSDTPAPISGDDDRLAATLDLRIKWPLSELTNLLHQLIARLTGP